MNIKKFESNVQFTKYLVNREITERFIKMGKDVEVTYI